jgi:hypothetical protein
MRPWSSAQPCARRQAQIDQGGFANAAAVTATVRTATRRPRERLFESRPSRRSGPRRRPRSIPHPQSHGAADNRSLNLLGATRIDHQKPVALIEADLRIVDHCSDWPPRVPRLASRHAIPRGVPGSGDASHDRSRSRSLVPPRRPQRPGRGGRPELRTVPQRRQQLLLLRASTGAAALVNPQLALSVSRRSRTASANGGPRLRRPDHVIAGDGNGPGHCAHRSVADSLNPDQPQPCSGNTTESHPPLSLSA